MVSESARERERELSLHAETQFSCGDRLVVNTYRAKGAIRKLTRVPSYLHNPKGPSAPTFISKIE